VTERGIFHNIQEITLRAPGRELRWSRKIGKSKSGEFTMMKRHGTILITLVVATLITTIIPSRRATAEFQFPLKSISPKTTPYGEQRVRIGMEYNKGERLLFKTVDKNRKIYSIPIIDIAMGVSSNVELLFCYPFHYLKQEGQESNYGSGDLRIAGIFRVYKESKILPECGIKFAVKLPNADDTKEFGTDETDFFFGGVFSKRFGKLKILLNTDLAILGNPSTTETKQDDVLIYKAGGLYLLRENVVLGCEIEGTEFSRFGNNRRFLRGGIAFNVKNLLFDLAAAAGLNEPSGDYQFSVGVTLKFGIAKRPASCP
jgi:hypothetical protein